MRKKEKRPERVLVVEDEPRILRFIRTALTSSGYDVIETTRGDEVIDLVNLKKPDIVLLDVYLPGRDGLEVLQELRTFSRLPVIVISARNSLGADALKLGASEFIAKPFKPAYLTQRIRALLTD